MIQNIRLKIILPGQVTLAGQFHFESVRYEQLMKSLISASFFLVLLLISCKESPVTQEQVDPGSGFHTIYSIRKEDNVYHGPYQKTDSTGLLLERGNYADGDLHGIREILFPDGKVKIRERYARGVITDLYEYFFDNGQVELKGYYIDGAMYGPWKKYDEKGNLVEVVTMVNNEEMGPFTEYYENGRVQVEGSYLHGPNEDGILNMFDETGELYKKMLCDSGICITVWKKG